MIVITTPTGQIGHQVLDGVLGDGVPVRVLARDPSRLPSRVRERVEVVQGSLDDVGVVAKAFEGAAGVFWLVPPTPAADGMRGPALEFTRTLCEAVESQSVQRLVYISALRGDGDPRQGHGATSLIMDEMIESTGVSRRALRMPGFMENLLQQIGPLRSQGMFFFPVSGDRRLPACATRDVAATAARLLLDDSWSGQADVPILGPEDLSYNEMAQIMSEVLERPIRYQRVPGDAFKAGLMRNGMSEGWAQGLVDLLTEVDQGVYNAEPRTPESSSPTTFRQWCEDVLRPAFLG
ncbi:NmrA family NAD(P)-binding protein [Actinoallomurus acaciae]|uniref:NmrA family NAD(P)-binding protein n=1 Tax=Actinoallomurus acaciae TaxID=502577 RepID=A0ABV5YT69_9ACTN